MQVGERSLYVIHTLIQAAKVERDMHKRRLEAAESQLLALLWAGGEAVQHSGGKDPEAHLGNTPAAKAILKLAKRETNDHEQE